MLSLACILILFAAMVGCYFRVPERWQTGGAPMMRVRHGLGGLTVVGMASGFAIAVSAEGWAAGIGLWLAALMAMGVVVVSIAGTHPVLTGRLGLSAGGAAILLVAARWAAA